MIIFSSSFKLNKFHIVHGPYKEDPKNIFFQGGPDFLGGTARKKKMGNNKDIYCYANRGK